MSLACRYPAFEHEGADALGQGRSVGTAERLAGLGCERADHLEAEHEARPHLLDADAQDVIGVPRLEQLPRVRDRVRARAAAGAVGHELAARRELPSDRGGYRVAPF